MIELKKNNIFLYGDVYSLLEFIKILDLCNMNFIYMHNEKTRFAATMSMVCNKVFYQNIYLLESIDVNKFRLDFILIEPDNINWTLNEIKDIDIPIIYIKKTDDPMKFKKWELALNFRREEPPISSVSSLRSNIYDDESDKLDKCIVDDLVNDETYTLRNYITSLRRDMFISNIISPK